MEIRTIRRAAVAALTLALLALPATAGAATVVQPTADQHFEWFMVKPMAAADLATGEQPKWFLLASDAGMTKTVRYCRQWVQAQVAGGIHLGCNAWAVGTDGWGQDIVRPLTWNTTFYAQLVYTDAAGAEQKTAPVAFTIDDEPATESIGELSDKIYGSVYGDGTELNLGTAAFVNSGVKTPTVSDTRVKANRFRILVKYTGDVDFTRSYVRVQSKAGTRFLKLEPFGAGTARAVWKRNSAEAHLANRRYTYQAFLLAKKNGALVRSAPAVILEKTRAKKRRAVPAWRPL